MHQDTNAAKAFTRSFCDHSFALHWDSSKNYKFASVHKIVFCDDQPYEQTINMHFWDSYIACWNVRLSVETDLFTNLIICTENSWLFFTLCRQMLWINCSIIWSNNFLMAVTTWQLISQDENLHNSRQSQEFLL